MRIWQNVNILARFGEVGLFAIVPPARIPERIDWPPILTAAEAYPVPAQGPLLRKINNLLTLATPGAHSIARSEAASAFEAFVAQYRPDVVVVEEPFVAPVLFRRKLSELNVIYDAHNVQCLLQKSLDQLRHIGVIRAQLSFLRMKALEGALVRKSARIWACSVEDAAAFHRLYPPCPPTDIIPNTLDVSSYDAERSGTEPSPDGCGREFDIVYTGLMRYFPNQDAAKFLIDKLLPALQSRGCDARLFLVGRDPPQWMRERAKKDPAVIVTGEVEDTSQYMRAAKAMVVPLQHGSGTRLKILEAFASRCPVISTAKGAEGLNAMPGKHFLEAETVEEIAGALLKLRENPDLAARLGDAGLRFVQENFSWDVAAEKVSASLSSLFPSRSAR